MTRRKIKLKESPTKPVVKRRKQGAKSRRKIRLERTSTKPVDERREHGKELRERAPLETHADWSPGPWRPDPIALIESQNEGRIDWLVPVRRARMSASPFAFYRGAAKIMAADLAETPVTGMSVQASGDAHLCNFGMYASPERRLVFDLNDFDETLPGPWEWDVKRLATSVTIAARHNRLKGRHTREVTMRVLRAYRRGMRQLSKMSTTKMWYAHLKSSDFVRTAAKEGQEREAKRAISKAMSKDSRHALNALAEKHDDAYRIRSEPPLLVPLRDLTEARGRLRYETLLEEDFELYKESLPDHSKRLLNRFTPVDAALKVVGVGSVGTFTFVMLLEGRDPRDPLFLQIKQAGPSVLEEYLPASSYQSHARRVVEGQRLMQTVSDIFLGWLRREATGNDYYWRQLRDWKGSVDVEEADVDDLRYYAELCGWTLARSHARSGDAAAIAGYLGKADDFDEAVTRFAARYAEQNELDYEAFTEAIRSGRLEASEVS